MLKDFAFTLLGLLPPDTRNDIMFRVQILTQKNVLEKWEKRGKPVPPPHLVKQSIIRDYQAISKYKILVETGTYLGHMIEAQKIYSVLFIQLNLALNIGKRRKINSKKIRMLN